MNEKQLTPMNLQFFGADGEPAPAPEPVPAPVAQAQPTPQPAAPTPPQAVNVDINAIAQIAEQKAEQKMQAVFKDMLRQQGFDADTINTMTTEWKAKQTTPEQELKLRDETILTLNGQLESERQEKIALSKGVPLATEDEAVKGKVSAVLTLAKSYMSDTVTFDKALDEALKIISFEAKKDVPPLPWTGGGKAPIKSNIPDDAMTAAIKRGAGIKEK